MKDTHITHAFNSLASEAQPRQASWHRVERTIRRRYRLRLFSSVVTPIAILAAVVTVAPRIGGALRNDRFAGPDNGASLTSTRVAFRDDFARFYFSFPSDLEFHGFQDGVPGVTLEAKDGSLTIEIFSQPPGRDLVATSKGLQAQELDPIAGGKAERYAEPGAEGPQRRELYRITWSYGTSDLQKVVILQFMATTSSDEARAKYDDLINQLVRSTAKIEDFRPQRWLDTAIYTPWGRVDAGVPFDDATSLVTQFLSARADDESVTDSRSGTTYRIERYGISPSIYYEAAALQAVAGYAVVKATTWTNGDREFTVRIDGGRDEAVVVTRNASGDLKIRDVRTV